MYLDAQSFVNVKLITAAKEVTVTPAIELLKKQKIAFEVLSYEHDANHPSFGLEAVEKLNLPSELVFKTLVFETNEKQLLVAIAPVNQQVNLKLLAKVCGAKKVHMAPPQQVENSTGYILGGVSPLGQKKRLRTFVHSSAQHQQTIYVSAGKRGLEIALSPQNLLLLCNGRYADY